METADKIRELREQTEMKKLLENIPTMFFWKRKSRRVTTRKKCVLMGLSN